MLFVGGRADTSSLVLGRIRDIYNGKCLISGNRLVSRRGVEQRAGKSIHREGIEVVWLVHSWVHSFLVCKGFNVSSACSYIHALYVLICNWPRDEQVPLSGWLGSLRFLSTNRMMRVILWQQKQQQQHSYSSDASQFLGMLFHVGRDTGVSVDDIADRSSLWLGSKRKEIT